MFVSPNESSLYSDVKELFINRAIASKTVVFTLLANRKICQKIFSKYSFSSADQFDGNKHMYHVHTVI